MKQALGLVEIQGMSTAVAVADTMVKAANIRIIEMENTRGLGYMTIKVAGDVGAVNAAVNAGCQVGLIHDKLVSSKVIPRPSDYVETTFCNPEPLTLEEETAPDSKEEPETAQPEATAKPDPAADTAAADTATATETTDLGPAEAEAKKPPTSRSAAKKTGTPKNKK